MAVGKALRWSRPGMQGCKPPAFRSAALGPVGPSGQDLSDKLVLSGVHNAEALIVGSLFAFAC